MRGARLAERLRGRREPLGYVSFLSALVHHGVLVDALATIQVASPELAGRDRDAQPGPVDFIPIPRDLFFGFRIEPFEGETLPVASPEKALLDWVHHAEEHAIEPRLDEIEWESLDLSRLDLLAMECGIDYRALLPDSIRASCHDQALLRQEAIERLRG